MDGLAFYVIFDIMENAIEGQREHKMAIDRKNKTGSAVMHKERTNDFNNF